MIIRTMIIASEGHFVTDGNTYGKVVIPAENADTTAFREITDEEYFVLFPEEGAVEVTENDAGLEFFEDDHAVDEGDLTANGV